MVRCVLLVAFFATSALAMLFGNFALASADVCASVKTTADGFVALRSAPNANGKMLMKLRPGDRVVGNVGQGQGPALPAWVAVTQVTTTTGTSRKKQQIAIDGYVSGKLLTETECSGL